LVFAGLVTLIRARVSSAPSTLWIDGLTAALAAASVSAAVVVQPLLEATGGETAAVATNLAYSVGDLILLGTIITAVALDDWRPQRTWVVLGAGIVLFWVADSVYLVATANGSYVYPGPADQGWTLCLILFAVAARVPAGRPAATRGLPGVRSAVLPTAFAAAGLAVLVLAAQGLNPLAVALAACSLIAVFARLTLTLHENTQLLRRTSEEALTDALTGLGNRRALTGALAGALDGGAGARPCVLVLLDLDGFKHYNDSFGHPAGDALLQRLGMTLAAHVGGDDQAFRIGGDEFCVLLRGQAGPGAAARAAAALTCSGEGFSIGASFGEVRLPPSPRRPNAR
jgi:GGDEF domain-containing protein